ncbi:MAG TPA: mucoidy inhibitor MuiA family protein [Candidatus Acidoferrales bacterium]|nr:mucoidy inhibitor MuiA family protein [Candidatus Acidoferrales bacterium]
MNAKKVLSFGIVILIASFIFSSASRASQDVKSKVSAVTVYADRALIIRTAEVNLSPGMNTVEFAGLPVILADQSLRVSGESESNVKVLDVQIKMVFKDTISNEHVRELYDQLSSLQNEEQILEKRMDVLDAEMSFLDSLRIYYARSAQVGAVKSSYEDWAKMVSFLEKNMDAINEKIINTGARLREVKDQILTIQTEAQQMQNFPKKTEKRVVVTLSSNKSDSANLQVSYVIGAASWAPLYDLHATSGDKVMELTYSGVVRQATGEDWKNVMVTLSTAQPVANGAPPVLVPWQAGQHQMISQIPTINLQKDVGENNQQSMASLSLGIVQEPGPGNTIRGRIIDRVTDEALPGANVVVVGTNYGAATNLDGYYSIANVPNGNYQLRVLLVGYQAMTSATFGVNSSSTRRGDFLLGPLSIQGKEVVVTAERQSQRTNIFQQLASNGTVSSPSSNAVTYYAAEVHERTASSTFVIPAPTDIPSDNNPHKVTIAIADLPVDLSYMCVPLASPGAYLTGRTKDSTDYPFISGPANVFLDNSFVATTSIGTVFPGEEFQTYLGTDEAIKVGRKLLKEFTESTGLLSKKTKTTYDYLITVENDKKVPVDIDVKDQIPVSSDEKIVVELLAPAPTEAKPDEQGIIDWHLKLSPQEKKELHLKFSIEYPGDAIVR